MCIYGQANLLANYMNLDDLKYFLALARERTMSGAGKKLRVKHTTVARRVASLEEEFGSRLFDRLPEGHFLTQAGENLFKHAVNIEEQAYEAQRDLLGRDAKLEGPLKVTAPYDFFCNVIAPRLQEFTDAYADIDLEFICSPALLDLATLEADIALRLTATPPDNLIGRQILPLRHGVYGSETYLNGERPVDRLILWRSERVLPAWARDHFPDGQVLVHTDEAETMLAMVRNHMGLARMACYIAEVEPSLRRLDVSLTPSNWGVWILNHTDLRSTARVRVCKEFLTSIVQGQSATILGEASKYFS